MHPRPRPSPTWAIPAPRRRFLAGPRRFRVPWPRGLELRPTPPGVAAQEQSRALTPIDTLPLHVDAQEPGWDVTREHTRARAGTVSAAPTLPQSAPQQRLHGSWGTLPDELGRLSVSVVVLVSRALLVLLLAVCLLLIADLLLPRLAPTLQSSVPR